jgi:hypothetical protein
MKKLMTSLALAIFMATLAFAQTNTGRLSGTVSGPDGLLPGATVSLTDTKTGKERTIVSNSEGNYSFQLLDYGEYKIKVSAAGFKASAATITINIAQEYSFPVTLSVGDVSETVTVTGGAEIINSTNAELTSTISNRQITELPLAARNPLALILTQAGSSSNPSQNTSINGGRTSSTNITRDGVNINDNFIRSNATDFAPGRPSVDNVEEFSLSSQSSVDTGFGSAQITFVTPRGSNSFHGAVWEYNRNSKFGANSFFNNAGGNYGPNDAVVVSGFRRAGEEKVPRPFRNRNQYGFKVAGPIIKNKLFAFVYAEKLNDIVTSSKLVTVLTPQARAGIFRYQSGATVYSVNIFTPGAFTAGTSGIAPPTAINPLVTSRYLSGMAQPNSFDSGDGLNTLGYRYSQHGDQKRKSFTSRVDYDATSTNNINAVIDYQFETNLRNDLDTINPFPIVLQPARNVLYSGGWRWSPTSRVSNEFRIGRLYSKPDFFRTDQPANEYYTTPLITNPQPLNGAAVFRPQGRAVKTFNMQDTVSWILGNHSLRLGGQFQQVKISAYNDAGNLPVYAIGLSTTVGPQLQSGVLSTAAGSPALTAAQQTTARSLFALLGGVLASGSQTFNATSQTSGFVRGATNLRIYKYEMYAPYIVDQWRISTNLTLSLGLRYDYQKPLVGVNGLYFEPVIASGRSPKDAVLDPTGTFQFIGGNAGKANTFYKQDKNNFAPSVGFAWSPKFSNSLLKWMAGENFVIRGGYRRSYVNDELVRAPDNALANHPGFSSAVSALFSGATAIDDRFGAAHGSSLATPTFVTTRTYVTNNTAAFSNTGTAFAIDPNLQTPNQNDYTFGIQRQFGDWVAEVRYVGGYSKNMLRTIDYNQITIPAAYRADFDRVRANLLAGCPAGNGGALGSAAACANGTTLITTMGGFGAITPGSANGNLVLTGQIAELAWQQLLGGQIPNPNVVPYPTGTLRAQFLPNPNIGVANVLENGGSYYYNAAQFELRRRFKQGLALQANYSFSKELTDAIGTAQTRVEPFLDNSRRSLDYARADYDQTHVFNMNAIYELPFGRNKRYLNDSRWLDHVVGGWQIGMIWRLASGAPITFIDPRGTLNRSGRAGRQTALTNLSERDLRRVVGVFKTRCGIYFVDPSRININQQNLAAGNCSALTSGLLTGTTGGAGSSGFGQPTFTNQVFFSNGPNNTSPLRRAIVNGPMLSSADISLIKKFHITERMNFQVRAEAYNFLNTPYFAPGQLIDINSTSFGRMTSVAVGARVIQFAGRLTF